MKSYPKINFKYSWIYDQTWKSGWLMKKVKNYPDERKILNYIKKIEKLWRKEEKRVLKELSRVSKLEWQSDFIDCFVVGKCRPFSYPLTIPVYEKYPDYFIDVLIHELIHNLFIQNEKKLRKIRQYFDRKYKKEEKVTKIHISLHAIHSHIYLKFYGKDRLDRDVKWISRVPAYKKSWQIVQKEGYQNIIREFTEKIN